MCQGCERDLSRAGRQVSVKSTDLSWALVIYEIDQTWPFSSFHWVLKPPLLFCSCQELFSNKGKYLGVSEMEDREDPAPSAEAVSWMPGSWGRGLLFSLVKLGEISLVITVEEVTAWDSYFTEFLSIIMLGFSELAACPKDNNWRHLATSFRDH